MATNSMARMIWIGFVLALLPIASSAGTLPFAFGNSTNDLFLGRNDTGRSENISLPQPMAYLDSNVTSVVQGIDGFIIMYANDGSFAGAVDVYFMDIDTRNGGMNQNQIWLRVGNRTEDLNIARDIFAGAGILFAPLAVIVGTWNKVEAFDRRVGAQNTFQFALAYSTTGETRLILAYEQLQFFSPFFSQGGAKVGCIDKQGFLAPVGFSIDVDSDADMNFLLNATNCKRPGILAIPINKGAQTKAPMKAPTKTPTKAPTKTPTNAPTKTPTKATTKTPAKAPTTAPTPAKCGLLGWSIFCRLTRCGVFGRVFKRCKT